jgi:glycosyltransferase involved in cell wall biosynthesis
LIGVAHDNLAVSLRKVGIITEKALRRAGFSVRRVDITNYFFLGNFADLILICETVTGLRSGYHSFWVSLGRNRIWWSDTNIELDPVRDSDVDFINNYYCFVATSRFEAKTYRERGIRVCKVVGRPVDEFEVEKALATPDEKYRKMFGKYILTIGRDLTVPHKYPRKGLDVFDEAIGLIKPILRSKGIRVVAVSNWKFRNVDVVLDNVPEPELYQLIKQSELFVFPSRREGFGMPPVEAMALGKLVVYTDVPSHNEHTIGVKVLSDYYEVEDYVPLLGRRRLWDYRAKDLADAILYALDLLEKGEAEPIVKQAMEKAREFYSLRVVSELYKVVHGA